MQYKEFKPVIIATMVMIVMIGALCIATPAMAGGVEILIDTVDKRTISTTTPLQLEEGYELKLIQLDIDGVHAMIELLKNGKSVDTDIVTSPDIYVYEKDIGEEDDVAIITVHISSIISDAETEMVVIDSIYQISEDYCPVNTKATLVTYTISDTVITPPQTTSIDLKFSGQVQAIIQIRETDGSFVKTLRGGATVNACASGVWDGTYGDGAQRDGINMIGTTVPAGTYSVYIYWRTSAEEKWDCDHSKTIAVGTVVTPTPTVEATPAQNEVATPAPTVEATPEPTPTPTATPMFRIAPTVILRPVNDVISKSQSGLIELYMNNPSLNDVTLTADVQISVPSGLSVNGDGLGYGGAAGTVAGKFTVPPGTVRTINIYIKGERAGVFTIHFTGLYWAGDDKDGFQQVSLTHRLTVTDPDTIEREPLPIETNTPSPDTVPINNTESNSIPITYIVIGLAGLVVMLVIALVARK